MKLSLVIIVMALGQVALGAEAPAKPLGPDACKPVRDACEKAGFKDGAAKDGIGLFNHCIKPLVTKSPQPPNAKKKLPKGVKKADLDKCLATNPNFQKK